VFSCPKIAGGGQASQRSKLLEIKGYEVFRVDRESGSEHGVPCSCVCVILTFLAETQGRKRMLRIQVLPLRQNVIRREFL
jgi:hypothetical protein